jgi:RIO kinase 1
MKTPGSSGARQPLLMELVTDAAGNPAPRSGEIELSAEQAREYHGVLIGQIVRMLSIGLIHGNR